MEILLENKNKLKGLITQVVDDPKTETIIFIWDDGERFRVFGPQMKLSKLLRSLADNIDEIEELH